MEDKIIKFRPHKGGLAESFAMERTITSGKDIVDMYKKDILSWRLFDFNSFRCEYYGKDNRNIGYDDTYAIKVNYIFGGIEHETIVGYTNQEVNF